MIKPKLLLQVLSKKFSVLTYFVEILLDKIIVLILHSAVLPKMERLIKNRLKCDNNLEKIFISVQEISALIMGG